MMQRPGGGLGKARVQGVDPHLPAQVAQTRDHAAVIDVPAGRRLQVTGNDELQQTHAHRRLSSPSNAAQATCDSCRVTRKALTDAAEGPSRPSRIAWVRRSKTVRARNSVVVLRPAKSDS